MRRTAGRPNTAFENWGVSALVFSIIAVVLGIIAIWTGSGRMGGTAGVLGGVAFVCLMGMLVTSDGF